MRAIIRRCDEVFYFDSRAYRAIPGEVTRIRREISGGFLPIAASTLLADPRHDLEGAIVLRGLAIKEGYRVAIGALSRLRGRLLL